MHPSTNFQHNNMWSSFKGLHHHSTSSWESANTALENRICLMSQTLLHRNLTLEHGSQLPDEGWTAGTSWIHQLLNECIVMGVDARCYHCTNSNTMSGIFHWILIEHPKHPALIAPEQLVSIHHQCAHCSCSIRHYSFLEVTLSRKTWSLFLWKPLSFS